MGIAVTAVVSLAVAAPADAAATKYPRVIAVTASDSFLVYRQKTSTVSGLYITKKSALYFVGKSGGRHLLKDFDPELFPTLQGSTLAQSVQPNAKYDPDHDPSLPEQIRWRDLKTGATGVTEIPATDDYIGAAPGGWIAVRSAAGGAAAHLVRYSTGGKVVDLGAPIANTSLFTVSPGPEGVLAYSKNGDDTKSTGLIRYMPYSTPGKWRTVYAAGAGNDATCGHVSKMAVVCDVDAPTKHAGEVLFSLTSSRKVWMSGHSKVCQTTGFVAVGDTAVGKDTSDSTSCVRGRLTALSTKGKVIHSQVFWGKHASGITEGFGRILLDSNDQRRIVSIKSVRSTPHTVVTAH